MTVEAPLSLAFVQDDECRCHWAADREWCKDDPDPDWLALASLLVASLVGLGAMFLV